MSERCRQKQQEAEAHMAGHAQDDGMPAYRPHLYMLESCMARFGMGWPLWRLRRPNDRRSNIVVKVSGFWQYTGPCSPAAAEV